MEASGNTARDKAYSSIKNLGTSVVPANVEFMYDETTDIIDIFHKTKQDYVTAKILIINKNLLIHLKGQIFLALIS